MRAVLFEGKERMRIASMPRPACGTDEVLLQVAACGICGGDARSYFSGDKFTGRVRIPGHEPVGVVAEAGSRVSEWKRGDRLALAADVHCRECWYCRRELFNMCEKHQVLGKHMNGGLTDYMLLTREILEHGIINRVPEGLSLLHAAVSEPLCSVLASHDDLCIQADETVVILGSGPMGLLHYELLRARGARVILVAATSRRLNRAKAEFGVEFTVDASAEDPVKRVRELTGGIGADVVITAAPSPGAVAQSIHYVRRRGRIGLFGGLPAAQAEVPIDINLVHYSEIRIMGNFSYHPRYHERSLQLLAAGAVRCHQLITTYKLEETEQGLHDIRNGNVLKAVVVPNEGALL